MPYDINTGQYVPEYSGLGAPQGALAQPVPNTPMTQAMQSQPQMMQPQQQQQPSPIAQQMGRQQDPRNATWAGALSDIGNIIGGGQAEGRAQQYRQQALEHNEALRRQQQGFGGVNAPSSVRETQWYMQQSPDVQHAHEKLKRGIPLTSEEKLEYQQALANIKRQSAIDTSDAVKTREAELKAEYNADLIRQEGFAREATKAATAANQTISNLGNAYGIYQTAIDAIDEGAESGAFAQYAPTFKASTIKLQNAIRKAGLNTISGVTLGAISKDELKLVLAADIPEGMNESELRPYLVDKQKATQKVMRKLSETSEFLEQPGNTVSMWNKQQKAGAKPGDFFYEEETVTGDTTPTGGVTEQDINSMTEAQLDAYLAGGQ